MPFNKADLTEAFVDGQNSFLHKAYEITRSFEDAADVVQNAYVRALLAWDGYKGESAVRTWLYRIVINTALSARRREERHHRGGLDAELIADYNNNPQQHAEQAEFMKDLSEAADGMKRRYMIVFTLRYFDHHSREEIARLLDDKPENVRNVLNRARKNLKQRLCEHDPHAR